jgi:hypothetical protein
MEYRMVQLVALVGPRSRQYRVKVAGRLLASIPVVPDSAFAGADNHHKCRILDISPLPAEAMPDESQ